MSTIIDRDYIIKNSVSMSLSNIASDNGIWIDKLIDNINKKIMSYIDSDLFPDDPDNTDEKIYPDDLKEVALFLVGSYFITYGLDGREFGMREKKSEKIGDYSYSKSYDRESDLSPIYFFDIPITQGHLDILNTYKSGPLSFGYFNIPG